MTLVMTKNNISSEVNVRTFDESPYLITKHMAYKKVEETRSPPSPGKRRVQQSGNASTQSYGNYLATDCFFPVPHKTVSRSILRNRILYFGAILFVVFFTTIWLLAGF